PPPLGAGPPGGPGFGEGPASAPLGSGPGVRDRPGPHTPAAVPLIASGGPARLTGPPPTARFARLGLRLRRILVDTPYPAGPTLLPAVRSVSTCISEVNHVLALSGSCRRPGCSAVRGRNRRRPARRWWARRRRSPPPAAPPPGAWCPFPAVSPPA